MKDLYQKEKPSLNMSSATFKNWEKTGNLSLMIDEKNKLKNRANKTNSVKTFIPDEYIKVDESFLSILNFCHLKKIDISAATFLLALRLLTIENILKEISFLELSKIEKVNFKNKQIKIEITDWYKNVCHLVDEEAFTFFKNIPLKNGTDILGAFYQSLLLEGVKSKNGSYYTPESIVSDIVKEFVKPDSKVFDPCCGSGQFILAFSKIITDPRNIYGADIDSIAVRIARLNILLQYRQINFSPNIVCKNTLLDIGNFDLFSLNDENIKDFDVIATNPPWGVHFSNEEIVELKKKFPEINSLESFSYFIKKSVDLLKDGGALSFILPESILNVKVHNDIRKYILNNTKIKKVVHLDRVFKNVFTPVVRLDLLKSNNRGDIFIQNGDNHKIKQSEWLKNQDYIFDIHSKDSDLKIIEKIYATKHITLEGNADWALGIVTGDNEKFITSKKADGQEPIYKGKEINKIVFSSPANYIEFRPESFQQVAPEKKYRAEEKLVYRFISKYLVFAYDDQQRLTLNSANIVIPRIKNYPIKAIAAILNSSPYQFIFQKKFSSIKVLRNQIESLPIPIWKDEIISEIINQTDDIILGKESFDRLDNFIMKNLLLSDQEIDYIKSFNQK